MELLSNRSHGYDFASDNTVYVMARCPQPFLPTVKKHEVQTLKDGHGRLALTVKFKQLNSIHNTKPNLWQRLPRVASSNTVKHAQQSDTPIVTTHRFSLYGYFYVRCCVTKTRLLPYAVCSPLQR